MQTHLFRYIEQEAYGVSVLRLSAQHSTEPTLWVSEQNSKQIEISFINKWNK